VVNKRSHVTCDIISIKGITLYKLRRKKDLKAEGKARHYHKTLILKVITKYEIIITYYLPITYYGAPVGMMQEVKSKNMTLLRINLFIKTWVLQSRTNQTGSQDQQLTNLCNCSTLCQCSSYTVPSTVRKFFSSHRT